MARPIQTLLAVLAIGLFLLALLQMSAGELMLAGLCFLSASVAIYFRETRR